MEFFFGLRSGLDIYMAMDTRGYIGFLFWDRGQAAGVLDVCLDQGTRQVSLSWR